MSWTANLVIFLSPREKERLRKAYERVKKRYRSMSEWARKVLLREADGILGDEPLGGPGGI